MALQPITIQTDSIQLRTNNPYSIGKLNTFEDGQATLTRKAIQYTPNYLDKYFMVGNGDNLSQIAFLAYGDSKLWWLIADANNIFNPFDLEVGLELVIPPIETLNLR